MHRATSAASVKHTVPVINQITNYSLLDTMKEGCKLQGQHHKLHIIMYIAKHAHSISLIFQNSTQSFQTSIDNLSQLFSFNFYQKNKINVAIHIQCTVYIILYSDVWSTELVLKKRKKKRLQSCKH